MSLSERKNHMKRILFSPDGDGGGEAASNPTNPPTENNPPPAPPAPPPAATTVLQGTRTEREIELEKKLKDREIELAHVQDENHQLKQVPASPASTPAAAAPAEDEDDWTAFPAK